MTTRKTIDVERLRELLSYDPDTGDLRWRANRGKMRAGSIAGATRPDNYRIVRFDYLHHFAHRLAWAYVTGEQPPDVIDHINGNPSDNRFCNLRPANQSLNSANQRVTWKNAAGLKGVTWDKKARRWRASISRNRKQIWLGYFDTPQQASAAYAAAAADLFGEFARAA